MSGLRPTAVLWVYQTVKGPHGTKMEAGQKPSLCVKGRKYIVCVSAGHPVRVVKRDVSDFNKLRHVAAPADKTKDYDIDKAVAAFERMAQTNGITKGAQELLDLIKSNSGDLREEELQNEEDQEMRETEKTAVDETPAAGDSETASTTTNEETNVAAKKKAKSKTAKAAKPVKKDKGPSKISQAVEYMKAEIKKTGGQKALEKGDRKALFEKTAKKFGLAEGTCATQYNKQIINGKK